MRSKTAVVVDHLTSHTRRPRSWFGWTAAIVFLFGCVAPVPGEVVLTYKGTFKAAAGYYKCSIAFVPSGSNGDRPVAVNVPTLLTGGAGHGANDPLKEWYIPTDASLAKVFTDTPPSAVQVMPVDGGTYVTNTASFPTGMALLNSRMYGLVGGLTPAYAKGEVKLGRNSDAYPTDFVNQPMNVTAYTTYAGGIAAKPDETDTLIMASWASGGAKNVYFSTCVKGAPTTPTGAFNWTTTLRFSFTGANAYSSGWPLSYITLGGTGYYVMYDSTTGTLGKATLDFYNASVCTGGVVVTSGPSFKLNIHDAIGNGYGWNTNNTVKSSYLMGIAYDPGTGRLYAIEPNPSNARANSQIPVIHVLQLASLPKVETVGFENVGENTADLVGRITEESALNVICYWGTNDQGTVAAAWQTNKSLGPFTSPATITNSVTGLEKGTVYYFRYFASNAVGSVWSTNTLGFSTAGVDPQVKVTNGTGADNVTSNSATLRGEVLGGVPDPHVWIYWGDSEGSTNDKSSWNKPVVDKDVRIAGPFSASVSGLLANKQYWYRCYGSNVNEDAWAPASATFTTALPGLSINSATVTEGSTNTTVTAEFTVTLSTTSGAPVSVDWQTTDGTAMAGSNDYVTASGTLTIPAGSISGTIQVTVNGDVEHENDETFTVALSNPVGVVLTPGLSGTATILTDDFSFFVRHGGSGSGNGLSWDNAFSNIQQAVDLLTANTADKTWVIQVEASTADQSYPASSRIMDADGFHVYANFEGGWQNVDTAPVQTGRSRVQGDGTQRGIDLTSNLPSAYSHYHRKVIGVNRFVISNVTDGIRIAQGPNGQDGDAVLNLKETTITANNNGVVLQYGAGGPTRLTASNVVILAGQGGVGHGVYIRGGANGSSITGSRIKSSEGHGVFVEAQWVTVAYFVRNNIVSISDSIIHDCWNGGLFIKDFDAPPYAEGTRVSLNRVQVVGNGTSGTNGGVYVEQNEAINQIRDTLVGAFTNCVIAGNAQYGIYLNGNLDTNSAYVAPVLVNCTIANNGGEGLFADSSENSANSLTIYNTIFANNGSNGVRVADISLSGPAVTEKFNDFYGNAGSNLVVVTTNSTLYPVLHVTDLMVDPVFCTKQPDPYRLGLGSPLLNAGTNAPAPAVDILLLARPDGDFVSMGAYETGIAGNAGTLIILR